MLTPEQIEKIESEAINIKDAIQAGYDARDKEKTVTPEVLEATIQFLIQQAVEKERERIAGDIKNIWYQEENRATDMNNYLQALSK